MYVFFYGQEIRQALFLSVIKRDPAMKISA